MRAMARILVERYLEEPAAYMALSQSSFQSSKNACEIAERPGIERSLERAIEVAQQTLRLDPSHDPARAQVYEPHTR
jgi:hypothetical protein